jgi:glycerol uptake facilitator-like aquaporin
VLRRLTAEGIGSLLLSATVIGSGVMAARLSAHNDAVALLANSGWIGAAYWFTASTSFANPAITIARSLSDTFAGIRPLDVPLFIVSQATGAMLAFWLSRWLFERFEPRPIS